MTKTNRQPPRGSHFKAHAGPGGRRALGTHAGRREPPGAASQPRGAHTRAGRLRRDGMELVRSCRSDTFRFSEGHLHHKAAKTDGLQREQLAFKT